MLGPVGREAQNRVLRSWREAELPQLLRVVPNRIHRAADLDTDRAPVASGRIDLAVKCRPDGSEVAARRAAPRSARWGDVSWLGRE